MSKPSKPRKKFIPKTKGDGHITLMEINSILFRIEDMLARLLHGELFIKNGIPVIKNWNNFITPAASALMDWANVFNRIMKNGSVPKEWTALSRLSEMIRDDGEFSEALIHEASKEIDLCRSIMRQMTRNQLRSYITTEMISKEEKTLGVTN